MWTCITVCVFVSESIQSVCTVKMYSLYSFYITLQFLTKFKKKMNELSLKVFVEYYCSLSNIPKEVHAFTFHIPRMLYYILCSNQTVTNVCLLVEGQRVPVQLQLSRHVE